MERIPKFVTWEPSVFLSMICCGTKTPPSSRKHGYASREASIGDRKRFTYNQRCYGLALETVSSDVSTHLSLAQELMELRKERKGPSSSFTGIRAMKFIRTQPPSAILWTSVHLLWYWTHSGRTPENLPGLKGSRQDSRSSR